MTTRIEPGRGWQLAYCTDCSSWRRITATPGHALRLAADHMQLVHDDTKAAARLRHRAAEQDAATRP